MIWRAERRQPPDILKFQIVRTLTPPGSRELLRQEQWPIGVTNDVQGGLSKDAS